MAAVALTLRSNWASTCSWRARLALGAKGIPYVTETVDILDSKRTSAARTVPSLLLEVFPENGDRAHQLPHRIPVPAATLARLSGSNTDTGSWEIHESVAIMEFLDEVGAFNDGERGGTLGPLGSASLFGSGSLFERARVREVVMHVTASGQPLQNVRVRNYLADILRGSASSFDEERTRAIVIDWSKHWTLHSLRLCEEALALADPHGSHRFALGDTFSAADCVLIPHAFAARKRYNVDLAQAYPRIHSLDIRLRNDAVWGPTLKTAHPLSQPDARPAENIFPGGTVTR